MTCRGVVMAGGAGAVDGFSEKRAPSVGSIVARSGRDKLAIKNELCTSQPRLHWCSLSKWFEPLTLFFIKGHFFHHMCGDASFRHVFM